MGRGRYDSADRITGFDPTPPGVRGELRRELEPPTATRQMRSSAHRLARHGAPPPVELASAKPESIASANADDL